jgi:hypothetical protein
MALAPEYPYASATELGGRTTPWLGTEESNGVREQATALPAMETAHDSDGSTLSSFSDDMDKGKSEWESDRPGPINGAEDMVTKVLHAEDDPSLNPWTIRMWIIGAHFRNH